MKTAILAAGALMAATFSPAPDASAANVNFSLKLAGPNGVVKIASPGHDGRKKAHKRRARKDHGYKRRGHKRHGYKRHWRPHHGWHGPRFRPWRPASRCMTPVQLRPFLRRHGWPHYRVAKLTHGVAVVYSHRWGAPYRVKVDLCKRRIVRVSR